MPRPFASGSRQAPDPYDQYLEQNGFYRKHTARDSSCLFRTVSEQMYANQMHHLIIRQRCVDYMRKHKDVFQKSIDRDIDEYLDEMSKPKTYGSLLELRAIAYLYRRNVILFEAYNTGTFMIKENDFADDFRIFFTPEKHFDTVFTSDFIEAAAFCQGICYEILYKNVFKLPDVMYAVEQMLHGNSLDFVKSKTQYAGAYPKKVIYADGREFDLNTPQETSCILDNNLLCHFHNPNFPQFADNLHHDMHIIEASQYDNQKITKTLDSLLPEKFISCVQQLLKDGITPFPYKVAKALDPDIYRNVEFDAWSEMRKEQRFKNWYMGGSNLQIGVKCLVKLGSSQSSLYNCHIQDMSPERGGPCLVYVEELAEKHTVPYESLQALPSELAKPWPLPFRYQKHMERNPEKTGPTDAKKPRRMNGKGRYRDIITSIKKEIYTEDDVSSEREEVSYQLKQFTSIQHYCPTSYEVLAMPFNVDHCTNNESIHQSRRNSTTSGISHGTNGTDLVKQEAKKDDENDLEFNAGDQYPPFGYEGCPETYYSYPYEGGLIHQGSQNPFYCMYNTHQFATPPNAVVPHGVFMQPTIPCSQQTTNSYFAPPPGVIPPPPAFFSGVSSSSHTAVSANMCRNNTGVIASVSGRVNFSANRSIIPSGDDLPHDIPTLRFFYNLGHDYYKQIQKSSSDSNVSHERGDNTTKLAQDLQSSLRLDKENNNLNPAKSDQNTSTQSNLPHNTKRFSSRYFNSKRNDKHTFRSGNNANNSNGGHNLRPPQVETHGKQILQKNAMGSSSSHAQSHVNSNSKITLANSTSVTNTSEQTIQTSPSSTLITNETWSNDFMNNMPLYNTQAGPMQYSGPCIPVYPENDNQPNIYVQPPPQIMTLPYGMYPFPQPSHPGASFPTYLAPQSGPPLHVPPPPPFAANNPFLTAATGANEPTPLVVNSDGMESGSYSIMSYQPVFYSPANGGNGPVTTGTQVQQGYWYPAAPQFAPNATPTTSANNNTSSTPSAISIPSR